MNDVVSSELAPFSTPRPRDGDRARPGPEKSPFNDIILTEGEVGLPSPDQERTVGDVLVLSSARRRVMSCMALAEEEREVACRSVDLSERVASEMS